MVVLITVVKMHKKYILYLIFVEADIVLQYFMTTCVSSLAPPCGDIDNMLVNYQSLNLNNTHIYNTIRSITKSGGEY